MLSKADGCVHGINSYFVISDNLCYYNVPSSGKGTETLMVFTVHACLTTDCKSSWCGTVNTQRGQGCIKEDDTAQLISSLPPFWNFSSVKVVTNLCDKVLTFT